MSTLTATRVAGTGYGTASTVLDNPATGGAASGLTFISGTATGNVDTSIHFLGGVGDRLLYAVLISDSRHLAWVDVDTGVIYSSGVVPQLASAGSGRSIHPRGFSPSKLSGSSLYYMIDYDTSAYDSSNGKGFQVHELSLDLVGP